MNPVFNFSNELNISIVNDTNEQGACNASPVNITHCILGSLNTSGICNISTSCETNPFYPADILLGPIDLRNYLQYGFEIVLYGYLLFPFSILLLTANILMIATFVINHLMSPTNILLSVIGILDSLTALCPGSVWFYLYAVLDYQYYLPFKWCRIYHDVAEVAPSIFHGASIILICMMAIQKYIIVAFPFKAMTLCSPTRTVIGTVFVLILIFGLASVGHFELNYFPVVLPSSNPSSNSTMLGCLVGAADWYSDYGLYNYFGTKLIVRAMAFSFPTTLGTLVFGILLLINFRRIKVRRKKMRSNHQEGPESRMTGAAIWMIIAFLLVELPSLMIQMVDSFQLKFGLEIMDGKLLIFISVVSNVIIMFTLPSNFIIYLFVCKTFRATFVATFRCRRQKKNAKVVACIQRPKQSRSTGTTTESTTESCKSEGTNHI